MHPDYKRVQQLSGGAICRGKCIAIVGVDGAAPVFCGGKASGAVSQQHQLCFEHLHAPVIFKEGAEDDGVGTMMRYCQNMACKRLRPLQDFVGFSSVCKLHTRGRVADGEAPTVGAGSAPDIVARMVLTEPLQLETHAAGSCGGPEGCTLTACDVVGCEKPIKGGFITCHDHSMVCDPQTFPPGPCRVSQRTLFGIRSTLTSTAVVILVVFFLGTWPHSADENPCSHFGPLCTYMPPASRYHPLVGCSLRMCNSAVAGAGGVSGCKWDGVQRLHPMQRCVCARVALSTRQRLHVQSMLLHG